MVARLTRHAVDFDLLLAQQEEVAREVEDFRGGEVLSRDVCHLRARHRG
jgi:hypothetical protein